MTVIDEWGRLVIWKQEWRRGRRCRWCRPSGLAHRDQVRGLIVITLHGVHYVPNQSMNLISVSKAIAKDGVSNRTLSTSPRPSTIRPSRWSTPTAPSPSTPFLLPND
eukprot:7958467-Pyramimonas_sp.AAC.1